MVNVKVDYSQRQFGQWKSYRCERIAKEIRKEYDDYFAEYDAQGDIESKRWTNDGGIATYAGTFDLWKKS